MCATCSAKTLQETGGSSAVACLGCLGYGHQTWSRISLLTLPLTITAEKIFRASVSCIHRYDQYLAAGIGMSNESNPHYLARKIQDFQRSTARGYSCPVCAETFQQEPILWQHAKSSHPDSLGYTNVGGEAEARKCFKQQALDRAYVVLRHLHIFVTLNK